jgi:hypothetical protein
MVVLDLNSTGTPRASPTATPNKISFEIFLGSELLFFKVI